VSGLVLALATLLTTLSRFLGLLAGFVLLTLLAALSGLVSLLVLLARVILLALIVLVGHDVSFLMLEGTK
jgi:hypothetical protein